MMVIFFRLSVISTPAHDLNETLEFRREQTRAASAVRDPGPVPTLAAPAPSARTRGGCSGLGKESGRGRAAVASTARRARSRRRREGASGRYKRANAWTRSFNQAWVAWVKAGVCWRDERALGWRVPAAARNRSVRRKRRHRSLSRRDFVSRMSPLRHSPSGERACPRGAAYPAVVSSSSSRSARIGFPSRSPSRRASCSDRRSWARTLPPWWKRLNAW
jgi:hypothetical protein